MKRDEVALSAILVPVDALMILLAFTVAYWLRLQTDVIYLLDFPLYLQFVVSVLPLWLAVFGLEGLYRVGSVRRGFDELAGIFVGVSLGVLLVMAAIFLTNTELNSRVILIYAYVLSLVFVWVGRWIVRSVQESLYRYGIGVRRVILIGKNGVALQLAAELIHRSELGYVYLGYIDPEAKGKGKVAGLGKRLGGIDELVAIVGRQHPDEFIVADSSLSDSTMLQILSVSNEQRIDLRLSPNILGVQTSHVTYQAMAGMPLIEVQRTPLQGWGRVIKRVIDVIGALVGIVVFSPVMLVTAIAVRLTSPGPVIYRNERVGQDKAVFTTYKFRTMRIEYCTGTQYGGEQALKEEAKLIEQQNTREGALYKIAHDPRLTPIGDVLRRLSLDEFPQFFNVLEGTMSLVGPRPHQPREVAKYKPWQEKLFTIKPGITGLAQISGRSDLHFDDEARLDISYIENWSVLFDLNILLRTPLSLIGKRRAA